MLFHYLEFFRWTVKYFKFRRFLAKTEPGDEIIITREVSHG